jgi:hypothetical protein
MFRRSFVRSSPSVLGMIVDAVATERVVLKPNDLYQLSALIAFGDTLQLAEDAKLMATLQATYGQTKDALSPFQTSQIEKALAKGGLAPTAVELASTEVAPDSTEAACLATLKAAHKEFSDRRVYDARAVNQVVAELDPLVRELSAATIAKVIRELAYINHQDYEFAVKLARRACDLATTLSLADACILFNKINKMSVQDSLVALVNRIAADGNAMKLSDCMHVIHGIEHQRQVYSNAAPLLATVLYLCHGRVKDMEVRFLVSMVDACAKYDLRSAPSTPDYIAEVARRADELSDRQLLTTLRHIVALKMLTADVFTPLLQRAVRAVPAVSIGTIEQWLDVMSMVSYPADDFMAAILARIEKDAGKLSPPQLVLILDIIASYPPAKASPAVPAMAFAAKVRMDSLDRDKAASVVLCLAELGYYGEEFFDIAFLLLHERQGFRSVQQLFDLIQLMQRAVVAQYPEVAGILNLAVKQLSPALRPEELDMVRTELRALNVDERYATKRVPRVPRDRDDGDRKKGKKKSNFNMKSAMWDMDD